MVEAPRHWVVVPAAGVGRRFGGVVPKQYLRLLDATVLDRTLSIFLEHPAIAGCVVALSPEDPWWAQSAHARDPRVQRAPGGAERADSVGNALGLLAERADARDWVLVHDAARPCLSRGDLDRLLAALAGEPVGALLAVPVHDTVKQSDVEAGDRIAGTVPRQRLWRAYTPQAFRLHLLREALAEAARRSLAVTDDAGAIELLGLQPRLVEGHPDNIKITRPEDLPLARFFLEMQAAAEREAAPAPAAD
jgi:2-C-methyl-D-erythritol 4-phosphate cytidylyltransferase